MSRQLDTSCMSECLVMLSDHKVSGGNAADGKRILVATPGLTIVAV